MYTRTTRQAHRLYTRAVGRPAMDAWIRYLEGTCRLKKRQRAAITIQRYARGYVVRGCVLFFYSPFLIITQLLLLLLLLLFAAAAVLWLVGSCCMCVIFLFIMVSATSCKVSKRYSLC